MSDDGGLSVRMRIFAREHEVPDGWIEVAEALEAAADGFYAEPQTVGARAFLGAYARARRIWCERTGEPLV